MIKSWIRDITLAIQARSGASAALFVCAAVAVIAALTAFAFLCITGYDWFAIQFGSVFAALIMTAIFAVVAIIAVVIGTLARRRTRERAVLERAERERAVLQQARSKPGFLDSKWLTLAIQVSRSVGWQRVAPLALFGFMAAQWVREYRQQASRKAPSRRRLLLWDIFILRDFLRPWLQLNVRLLRRNVRLLSLGLGCHD
jgi:uncharacterized membrane protein